MARVERHQIRFDGGPAAMGPATWAQHEMWSLMRARGPCGGFYNLSRTVLVPPGPTVADVLDRLAELVARHQSLRTLFHPGPDGDPVQQVVPAGEFPVDVLLTTSPRDPDPVGLAVRHERAMTREEFALDSDLPVRALVGVTDGVPRAVTLCVPHVAADLAGMRVAMAELAWSLDASEVRRRARPPAPQPLDLVAWQQSPAGRAAAGRAAAHLRAELATRPARMFPSARRAEFVACGIESPALDFALDLLALRHNVSTSVVLMTAVTTLLGRWCETSRCAVQLVAGNRFGPAERATVGNLIQEVPVTISVSGAEFADRLRATWTASMRAYRAARFPPGLLTEAARGRAVEMDCFLNDARASVRADPNRRPVALLPAAATFRPTDFRPDRPFTLLALDGVEAIRLLLAADTGVLSADQAERFLRRLEHELLELARSC
ncbi:condensation domain-containing protein [Kutzneria kofuensis]|uniref:Condensation domain-containing protein n=1 Tax=Kutzneria kofuensis TaxID=103725 RepID=A0A7W9KPY5_9PSEU|nr:condensation domain-containing protein [Kutzneria kofuensis]MBB5896283.1 hypothetical protein [Kutzneria kofuensis]